MEIKVREGLFLAAVALLVSGSQSRAEKMLELDGDAAASHNDVVYAVPAREGWQGLPLGNGRLGAQVWQPDRLLFQINTPFSGVYGGAIARLKFTTEPFMLDGLQTYRQRLSLDSATVTTEITGEQGDIYVRSFVPADTDGLILEVQDRRAGDVKRFVELEAWRQTASRNAADGILLVSDTLTVNRGSQGASLADQGLSDYRYALAVGIEGANTGEQAADQQNTIRLEIDGRRFAVHAAFFGTRQEQVDVVSVARERLEASMRRGVTAIRRDHEGWWRDFWSKSFVQLASDDGAADYLANLWYMHLYTMGIGSRGEVPPKFNGGLWLDDRDFREWGPSYWHWNTQEPYWPLYAGNHMELLDPYYNMYFGMLPRIERQTKDYFGINGAHYPEVCTFDGTDDSGKGTKVMGVHERLPVPEGFSFTNMVLSSGAEVSMQFWWRYLYTGDRQFLEQKAYPLMKSCAQFLGGYLSRDEAGRYYIYPSNAQEMYWKVKNPASDLAAIRYLLDSLIEASHVLDTDVASRRDWQEVLDHLAPYHINKETAGIAPYEPIPDQIVEATNVQNPELHPIGVFPLITLGSPDYELAMRTFRGRDYINDTGWTTDSICAARLGIAEEGHHGLKHLLTNHVARFQNHPSGLMDYYGRQPAIHPYLECSGTFSMGLGEMLLQSWPQGPDREPVIRICAALPEAWSARFKLLSMGGFVVTGAADRGNPFWVSIMSLRGGRALVANPFGQETIVTSGGSVILKSDSNLLKLETQPGHTYILTPASGASPKLAPFSTERNEAPKRLGRNGIGMSDTVSIGFMTPQCADLTVTLPGWTTPSLRMLLPEWISAANVDPMAEIDTPAPLHTVPGQWRAYERGSWTGVQTHPGAVEIRTRVEPHAYYVNLTITLRNLSRESYEELRADYCVNVNAGGSGWANREFLVESRRDRAEDGRYWYEHVAAKGAHVHAGGQWIRLFDRGEHPPPLDAGVIAVTNEDGNATVFMMWNTPVLEPFVNDTNACMHLRPLLSRSLAPGESATIHGRIGVTRDGRQDIRKLYTALPEPGR